MRFRPANIRLINRRSNLPRLLLALCSIESKNNDNDKNNPTDAQALTGSLHISKLAEAGRAWVRGFPPFTQRTRKGWGTGHFGSRKVREQQMQFLRFPLPLREAQGQGPFRRQQGWCAGLSI
jgi:hypothetical protein